MQSPLTAAGHPASGAAAEGGAAVEPTTGLLASQRATTDQKAAGNKAAASHETAVAQAAVAARKGAQDVGVKRSSTVDLSTDAKKLKAAEPDGADRIPETQYSKVRRESAFSSSMVLALLGKDI